MLAHFAAAAPTDPARHRSRPSSSTPAGGVSRTRHPSAPARPAKLWIGIVRPASRADRPAPARRRRAPRAPPRPGYAHRRRGHPPRLLLRGAAADAVLSTGCCPISSPRPAAGRNREPTSGMGRAEIPALYVRVAVGPGSPQRLREDEHHYRNIDERPSQALRRHATTPLSSARVAASTPTMFFNRPLTSRHSTSRSCAHSQTPTRPR